MHATPGRGDAREPRPRRSAQRRRRRAARASAMTKNGMPPIQIAAPRTGAGASTRHQHAGPFSMPRRRVRRQHRGCQDSAPRPAPASMRRLGRPPPREQAAPASTSASPAAHLTRLDERRTRRGQRRSPTPIPTVSTSTADLQRHWVSRLAREQPQRALHPATTDVRRTTAAPVRQHVLLQRPGQHQQEQHAARPPWTARRSSSPCRTIAQVAEQVDEQRHLRCGDGEGHVAPG